MRIIKFAAIGAALLLLAWGASAIAVCAVSSGRVFDGASMDAVPRQRVAVVMGIYPADRTVWCVEMVWAVGLWTVLLLTHRKFRFSTPAYLCFFVWTVFQLVGAHYTFEHVPMEWLMKPFGLVRNPYDRIAHFAVEWFAFPLAEFFFPQELGDVRWLCRVLHANGEKIFLGGAVGSRLGPSARPFGDGALPPLHPDAQLIIDKVLLDNV